MRPKHPSTLALVSVALLLLGGCSKSEDRAAEAAQSTNIDAPSSAALEIAGADQAPGLTSGAAPGVAFAYRYAFSLPAKAISSVQQQHAAACQRLGPARCQVNGMSYEQPREGEVSAHLDLLLAPDLAQKYGGDSIATVERAEGRLANASINGEDAGGAIEASQRQSAALRAELARVEKRLIAAGLAKEERASLAARAEGLRSRLATQQVAREDKEASLATTPMHFTYGSEGMFAAGDNPFAKAADNSLGSMKALLSFLLAFAGLALPWLLPIALIVLVLRFRAMKQRLARLSADSAADDPVAPL